MLVKLLINDNIGGVGPCSFDLSFESIPRIGEAIDLQINEKTRIIHVKSVIHKVRITDSGPTHYVVISTDPEKIHDTSLDCPAH